ncbi:hypothetical protein EJB05_16653 [Eragrostis curvula]|uniref:Uncharacterized protein n=1 Tax=Eragrostis curvula TaxID=38414 RepID=A0A5J9VH08_9POAL|nr:hypothetical protein EJB05_16653 [Eragrostis curvula]
MAERRPIYREPGQPRRPPRSHGGGGNFSVPLWEKKFCTDACAIPWGKLCETKRLMSLYKSVVDWDDSAALEAFEDAKARFYAEYHGWPCDIPLPDPNLYIDIVNPDERLDPELVADIDRSRRAVPKRDIAAPDGWDSFIFRDKPVPVTGWGDVETNNTFGQQCSVNWDNHLEQSIDGNCKQSSLNWDCYVKQPAQTIVQQSSANWDTYVEQPGQTSSLGEQTNSGIASWNMRDDSQDAWKHDYGWGSAAIQTDSWDNHRDSYDVRDSHGISYGHWRRRNNDSSRRNNRNRDRGGPISAKPMKSKYHADEHSGTNNGWRHCRVRNDMPYSYEQAGYTKQSLAM